MCFAVEDFSGDVPILSPEQQACEGDPLAGRTQPNVLQQNPDITGQGSVPAWPGRGIHVHGADHPGIVTPSVCRIRMEFKTSTRAVPTKAATLVSRLLANEPMMSGRLVN